MPSMFHDAHPRISHLCIYPVRRRVKDFKQGYTFSPCLSLSLSPQVSHGLEIEDVLVPILLPHEVLHALAMAGPEQVGVEACKLSQ